MPEARSLLWIQLALQKAFNLSLVEVSRREGDADDGRL
jgi:hypothetical protein